MTNLIFTLLRVSIIGLGATLCFDVWALFLKHAFGITPSNFCLIGRWLLHMPEGTFAHSNIGSAPQKRSECTIGWVAHYMIGIVFANVFVYFAGSDWLQCPALAPAIFFGFFTVLAPFLLMQPYFGLGVAASKTPNPGQARFRSLMNHAAFGIGLYIFGLLFLWLHQMFAE